MLSKIDSSCTQISIKDIAYVLRQQSQKVAQILKKLSKIDSSCHRKSLAFILVDSYQRLSCPQMAIKERQRIYLVSYPRQIDHFPRQLSSIDSSCPYLSIKDRRRHLIRPGSCNVSKNGLSYSLENRSVCVNVERLNIALYCIYFNLFIHVHSKEYKNIFFSFGFIYDKKKPTFSTNKKCFKPLSGLLFQKLCLQILEYFNLNKFTVT